MKKESIIDIMREPTYMASDIMQPSL